eukprot:1392688-Amorphochlora_amoeboformis.AAC.2
MLLEHWGLEWTAACSQSSGVGGHIVTVTRVWLQIYEDMRMSVIFNTWILYIEIDITAYQIIDILELTDAGRSAIFTFGEGGKGGIVPRCT